MSANLIGQILLDRYQVEAFVASGGMGAVYRVWDLQRSASLAMKVLHADLMDDPSAFRHFQREANALKQLAHPNIVPFYGLYQAGDFAFLLEGFIDGLTLKDLLRRTGRPLTPAESLVYLKAVCAALGYAHAGGVVHCDLKPANVMIDAAGQVYLTDFGIARHAESTTTTLGSSGTPGYMAPEQIRGEAVTPATDVYALGVLLFEVLAGRRPFLGEPGEGRGRGATTGELVRQAHLNQPPPDPRRFNPEIPPALAGAILTALQKDPARRFPDALAFFNAACAALRVEPRQVPDRVELEAGWIENRQRSVQRPVQGPDSRLFSPNPPAAAPAGPRPSSSWNRTGLALLGLAGLMVGIAVILGLLKQPPAPPAQPSRPAASPILQNLASVQETTNPPPTVTPAPLPIELSTSPTPVGQLKTAPSDGMVQVYVDGFWIDQTEVTHGMYARCVQAGICSPPGPADSNHPTVYYDHQEYLEYPVMRVNLSQAQTYCAWAGRRLPTADEWQTAAGAGQGSLYPWGSAAVSCALANYSSCQGTLDRVGARPGGASPFGALDMAGNVSEWVNETCPQGTSLYGGSYNDPVEKMAILNPICRLSNSQSTKLGFRCVEDASP